MGIQEHQPKQLYPRYSKNQFGKNVIKDFLSDNKARRMNLIK